MNRRPRMLLFLGTLAAVLMLSATALAGHGVFGGGKPTVVPPPGGGHCGHSDRKPPCRIDGDGDGDGDSGHGHHGHDHHPGRQAGHGERP